MKPKPMEEETFAELKIDGRDLIRLPLIRGTDGALAADVCELLFKRGMVQQVSLLNHAFKHPVYFSQSELHGI